MIIDNHNSVQTRHPNPFQHSLRFAYLLTEYDEPLRSCDGCDVLTSLTLQYNHVRPHMELRLKKLLSAEDKKICATLDALNISETEKKATGNKYDEEISVLFTRGEVWSLRTSAEAEIRSENPPRLKDSEKLPEITKAMASSMSQPVLMNLSTSYGHTVSKNLVLNQSELARVVKALVLEEGRRVKILVDAASSIAMINKFKDYITGRVNPLKSFCPQGFGSISCWEPKCFIANPMPQAMLGFQPSPFFFSGQEYTTVGIAQIELDRALEVKKIQAYEESAKKLILINFKGEDLAQVYEGLITKPGYGEYPLQPGDTFELQFSSSGWDFHDASWRATVLPLGSITKRGMLSVIVHRGQYRSSLQYSEYRPIAINATKLKKSGLDKAAEESPGNTVMVKIVDCNSTFTNIRAAYIKLNTQASKASNPYRTRIRKVLLGGRPDLFAIKDLYSHIRHADFDPLKYMMPLNSRQLDVVQAAGRIRGGIQLVQGPPGTGKTYTLQQLIVPFLTSKRKTIVLVAAPTNHGADDLARGMYDNLITLRQKHPETDAKKPYVLRAHAEFAEDLITRTQGPRPIGKDKKPGVQNPEPSTLVQETDFQLQLMAEYTAADKPKFEGVHDARVASIDYSIGYMKLLVSGVIPGSEHACADSAKFAGFRALYEKQASGRRLTAEEEKMWKTEGEKLTRIVVQGASAIISTTGTISKAALLSYVEENVAAVFMDESAFEREDSLIPLFAADFHLDPCFLMIGDHQQLNPLTKAEPEDNAFQPQLKVSFMTRMINVGMEYIMLTEQHRMISQISDIANTLTYQGKLVNDPCTLISNRPLATKFEAFVKERYKMTTNRLFIDVPPSKFNKVNKNEQSSKNNEFSICIVAELITSLLKEFGSEASIAILTSYKSQKRSYDRLEGNMRKAKLKNLDRIIFDTIDGAQGRQFDIVICDLVVGGSAGFLESENRLNVAMTRARDGLLIVGSSGMIEGAFYKQKLPTPHLKRLVDFFKSTTYNRERDDNKYPTTAFYTPCPPVEEKPKPRVYRNSDWWDDWCDRW